MKAVNNEGESEPLSADDFTTIKDPWDEPGKPGRPHVTDYDADRISLAWDPPMKDGGAPIEEYIIEVRGLLGSFGCNNMHFFRSGHEGMEGN